jgi:molybdopterin-synthase adenylyltransferase
VTDDALLQEAKNYGAAGGKPQVVWPNGALASGAVGLLMQLVTPWNENPIESAFLEYDGNLHTLVHGQRHKRMLGKPCTHYSQSELGDPFFDLRHLRATGTAVSSLLLKDAGKATEQNRSKRSWWVRICGR